MPQMTKTIPSNQSYLTPAELEAFGLSSHKAKALASQLREVAQATPKHKRDNLEVEDKTKVAKSAASLATVNKEIREAIYHKRHQNSLDNIVVTESDLHSSDSHPSSEKHSQEPKMIAEAILPDSSASNNIYPGAASLPEEDDKQLNNEDYQCLLNQHPTSFDLAAFYDKDIADGNTVLYEWQFEEAIRLCEFKATQHNPLLYVLCAANGSGKDAYVIAPFVVWFALCKIKSLCIITSASGGQLTAQTENYIRKLCEKVNAFWKQEIFRIRQRFIRCNLSGSEIRLFATDEAGKAEGYHPLDAGRSMCIIENEAKSISPEINQALRRCSGYSHWLKISTPGEPHGHFYDAFNSWPHTRKVTYYDCPRHMSRIDFDMDLRDLGEHSPLVRSKWFAEFTSIGGQIVITQEALDKCLAAHVPIQHQTWPLRIGIDYAKGGDELVIIGTKGNALAFMEAFRETDATFIADRIESILLNYGVEKSHDYIFADDGGVGSAITDIIVRRGWNINRVLNQSPAVDKKRFGNRGAEMWFRCARFFQERIWSYEGMTDKLLIKQLSNRYYKQQETQGRIFLQSKKEAKSEGRPSPDRADAFILSLTGLTMSDFLGEEKVKSNKNETIRPSIRISEPNLISQYEDSAYDIFVNNIKHKNAHNSLSAIL